MSLLWTPQYADGQYIAAGTQYTSPSETFGTGFSIAFVYNFICRISGFSSVTIAGVTASLLASGTDYSTTCWGAATTGSGTVVVNSPASFLQDILTTGGLLTGSTNTVYDHQGYGSGSTYTADPQTLPSLSIPAGGVGIVCIGGGVATQGNPTTWAGCTSTSSDEEAGPTTGASAAEIAMAHSTTTGGVVISATGNNGSGWGYAGSAILAVSFSPSGAAAGTPYNPWPQMGPILAQRTMIGWKKTLKGLWYPERKPKRPLWTPAYG